MRARSHIAIFTDNASRKMELAEQLLSGRPPEEFSFLNGRKGELFSNTRIGSFLEEEARHDESGLLPDGGRKLATYSSGERKKALLRFLLSQSLDFLILDNVFDNLDRQFSAQLRSDLEEISKTIVLIQFLSRAEDQLSFIQHNAFLHKTQLIGFPDYKPSGIQVSGSASVLQGSLPPAPSPIQVDSEILVEFNGVSLSYGEHAILKDLNWQVRKGEFWELKGPNGSGKTSLINMINGDSPKAYGQEIRLFGRRKGSGESVWDIKEKIGYFTPAITDRFRGYHQAENMLISGLTDSVGLYTIPTGQQKQLAQQWLRLLGMEDRAHTQFHKLTEGEQRLLMCSRAMIKHPPLLILDEPTAGLDESGASLVVALVRKMAMESHTAVIFVSHREEPGLEADHILELIPGSSGSHGIVQDGGQA